MELKSTKYQRVEWKILTVYVSSSIRLPVQIITVFKQKKEVKSYVYYSLTGRFSTAFVNTINFQMRF